ncbi:MAG: xanthine dehydrogenase family protein subunit M [Chloroflexi bacterium]|nr:xanthine dehydrogenase family protein subunit M [Chloroflexota bacterium]
MLRPFRLLEPTTAMEASAELRRLGDQARVYAGGAELVLLMRHGILQTDYLVNVKGIPSLHGVTWDGTVARIGAATTHSQVERDPIVRQRLPTLAQSAGTIGNIRVRNQGTIGGNLCFADPHSDPEAPLLVHDAQVVLSCTAGERRLPVDDFLVGTFETAIQPDEILTGVEAEPLPTGFGQAFLRIERYHRPTVNVASGVRAAEGRIAEARLAVGCVGARTIRLRDLETRVTGLGVDEATRVGREYGPILTELLEPVDDLLGSAEYKIHVACVLLGRAIGEAAHTNEAAES